jgi:hypothetical protein
VVVIGGRVCLGIIAINAVCFGAIVITSVAIFGITAGVFVIGIIITTSTTGKVTVATSTTVTTAVGCDFACRAEATASLE